MLNIHDMQQGTDAWLAHRAKIFNASEAPAVMGASKYTTRSQLLHQKHTGIAPDVDARTQELFDRGHAAEANARPIIEALIGDDITPLVASTEIDGMTIGASYDGITFMRDTVAEVKLWNEDLAAQVRAGELEPHYYWQLEQELMVANAERVIFACTDGTPERFVHMEYRAVPGRREQLIAGWAQFKKDLAAYVPADVKEMPKPEVTVALPALFIQAKGEITTSNMKEYGEALTARLAQIRSIQLVTDQDFSNAKESAKLLRDNIAAAKQAKEAMLAQTATVGETARLIDSMCEDMRLTALQLEKDVDREDLAKKAAMIATAKSAYNKHIEGLIADTGGPWSVLQAPDWASSIKGKRNFASMQDALDTALAQGKIAADESARKIRAALAALAEASKGYEHLFSDRLSFISQTAENVRMLAGARITQHKAAEQKRADELAEQARETIRKEEQAKAEKAASDKLAAELAEAQRLADEQARQATPPAAPAPEPVRVPVASAPVSAPAANVVPIARPAAPADTGARVKLGDIAASIAPLSITADGLAQLGFAHVATEKAAKLYRTADLPAIYAAMVAHIEAAQAQQAA